LASTRHHEWDAETYHRVADPQFEWGRRLLNSIELAGDEVVIDAGCGSGRLTRLLLERVPQGRVIAIDVSEQMIESARRNLDADFHGRVDYLLTNLLDLELDGVANVVFSTATFHWIPDQPRLYRNIARALRPSGRLIAQMGGKGNLARLLSRAERIVQQPEYQPYFAGWVGPWQFPAEEETRQRLKEAGFSALEVELFEEPTTFADAAAFREFTATVNFRLHLQRIPEASLREAFIERIVQEAAADRPPYTLDYWRLNLKGTRG
jgi:trans-aconitate 2-methyltransferase